MKTTLGIEFEPFFPQISHRAKIGCAKYDLSTGEGVAMEQWYLNMGEVPGTPLSQIVGIYSNVKPEDRECLKTSLSRLVHGETDHDQGEVRVRDGEGWKWVRLDIMEAGLEKSSRMPLNAIVGFSSLLGDEEDGELRQEYINLIQTNNELLLGIVNDVLDLAKLESGSMTFDFMEFDLRQLIVETVASFQIKVPRGVALTYPESLDSFLLRSDRIRLKQVLGNFITNAIKYTSIGSIILSYQAMENEVLLSVTDTGEGMSEEIKLHVFDRFYKGRNQKQGIGLGLSICQNIIERLGGRIGVSSEQGKGSCFWCTLPIFPPKDTY